MGKPIHPKAMQNIATYCFIMFLPDFPDAKSNKTSGNNITKASINTLTRYAASRNPSLPCTEQPALRGWPFCFGQSQNLERQMPLC
ncbi:hypothetical protein JEM67_02380 [Serratia sp. PAMC26656]|uniref:hypothetical protein n=1 Tax=Serratia sp. PAMC26656 TaxID=2775909 RepID=UPI0018F75F65|nr:hypothetical protein [Serratia sp. PAMC26656]MBJ7890236.1 hypothetical protein [Serratia sp. PAMC26656]